jgi:hypothetical protein
MVTRYCWLLVFFVATSAFADDQIRDVQEELRKRNMYFGDVDGKMTPELVSALRKYQTRKGFIVTGAVDETTAQSLHLKTETPVAAKKVNWPDVPVLKSDTALALEEEERQRLAQQAEQNPDAFATPAPPAEEPPPSQDLTREIVQEFVVEYLRDAEGPDIAAQTRYFVYPVDYFRHGPKGEPFVHKDVTSYCKRWPDRKYSLIGPVTFAASEQEGETIIEFPIEFSVRNKNHVVTGKTRNTWRVRPEGGELKIVAINEERLRE